jgi:hypothetical protein
MQESFMAENLNEISRDQLYSPISRDEITAEAKKDINPEEVPVMKPSWVMDGADVKEQHPGFYLAKKLNSVIRRDIYPNDHDPKADDRLYFMHPLMPHDFPFPKKEDFGQTAQAPVKGDSQTASYAHTQVVNLVEGEPDPADKERPAKILANLGYFGKDALNDYKNDYSLTDLSDEDAIARLESFHQNPTAA